MSDLLSADSRYRKLEQALLELEAFTSETIVTKRDRAGVIKAFEFTCELFWKTLQDVANAAGMTVAGPKPSLKAAFKLGIIDDEEQWLQMAEDRNLTSHIYNEGLAIDIVGRIVDSYLALMRRTSARIVEYIRTLDN